MTLVNETGMPVDYWIQTGNQADCGSLAVDGLIDLPQYDNQKNVYVGFNTQGNEVPFTINCGSTASGQQVEMALIVEMGDDASSTKSAK